MNIAETVCDRHARERPDAVALVEHRSGNLPAEVTFGELHERSARIAGGLSEAGIGSGDRVAITLPQSAEALAWHLAVLRLGAISVPISPVFSGHALRSRLGDSGSRLHVRSGTEVPDWGRPVRSAAEVSGDDPAFIFYTSGSTGPPKGVVTGHRVLEAVVPGFRRVFEEAPKEGDVFWTPSDWSWLGALCEVVLPTLSFGHRLVACAERFSVDGMYELLAARGVTCAFLVPHLLRRVCADPPLPSHELRLRAVMTGGERLGPSLATDAGRLLGAQVNDDFGLTEGTHLAIGSSRFDTPAGAVGRALPGREIAILDEQGARCPPGVLGEIGADASDPIVMLGYWNQPEATAERLRGGWLHTGDLGRIDEEGFLWFEGRRDDVFKVAGVRIAAEEIETVIRTHPDVVECGVTTTQAGDTGMQIVAFVQLRDGGHPSDATADAIRELVRAELAPHARPRVVRFVPEMPRTTTGKIRRGELWSI